MSAPFGPCVLTLDDMTKRMRSTVEGFTDPRRGKNTTYTMVDAALRQLPKNNAPGLRGYRLNDHVVLG